MSTPVDPVDPFMAFSDAVRLLQQQHPARFQVWVIARSLSSASTGVERL